MIEIDTTGIPDSINFLLYGWTKILSLAKEQALNDVGEKYAWYVRRTLQAGAPGWKRPHPLTIMSGGNNFVGLAESSRYRLTKNSVMTGFGSTFNRYARFSSELTKYSMLMMGSQIPVTDKMRRYLGSSKRWGENESRKGKDLKPGIDYFPIKKTTRQINIPPRLVPFIVDDIPKFVAKSLEKFFD